ncbi:MAG: hypothetical protein IJ374_04385 [Lachnospiraceae bacterium]|nr:hypothetical protein [Lachnospiraceae bacterium]
MIKIYSLKLSSPDPTVIAAVPPPTVVAPIIPSITRASAWRASPGTSLVLECIIIKVLFLELVEIIRHWKFSSFLFIVHDMFETDMCAGLYRRISGYAKTYCRPVQKHADDKKPRPEAGEI